jgi:hypothetical protein
MVADAEQSPVTEPAGERILLSSGVDPFMISPRQQTAPSIMSANEQKVK